MTNSMYAMGTPYGSVTNALTTLDAQLKAPAQSTAFIDLEKPLVQRWIARLRSGEYLAYIPQYTSASMYLSQIRNDHPDFLGQELRVWSALGVLGDIVAPWTFQLTSSMQSNAASISSQYVLSMNDYVTVNLPMPVEKLIGIPMALASQLLRMQQYGATFLQIADWIEQQVLPHARELS